MLNWKMFISYLQDKLRGTRNFSRTPSFYFCRIRPTSPLSPPSSPRVKSSLIATTSGEKERELWAQIECQRHSSLFLSSSETNIRVKSDWWNYSMFVDRKWKAFAQSNGFKPSSEMSSVCALRIQQRASCFYSFAATEVTVAAKLWVFFLCSIWFTSECLAKNIALLLLSFLPP